MNDTQSLNLCQRRAFKALKSDRNVFLTGVAGSGKSYLIRHFLKDKDPKKHPVLASTGAAAVLVGGRTFHSFFGLGIMQGGFEATVERALKSKKLIKRLKQTESVIIDEVSMLSGQTLRAAESICREAREDSRAWGGIRIIAVGDFAQLPPVSTMNQEKDWAFLDASWENSHFHPAVLRTIVRTQDQEFLEVLDEVRNGVVSSRVNEFLNERVASLDLKWEGTRLFPHRETTEKYNLDRLAEVPGNPVSIPTEYTGSEKHIGDLKRIAPIPETLSLKVGALVMLRQNDPLGRWVNGSLGQIERIELNRIRIFLLDGRGVEIEPAEFSLLDAEGKEVATARNFPLNLAYATTIHKAQGMTLDQVMVDLRNLWEPGQAYVALSRVKSAKGLRLVGWTPRSIKMDPRVAYYYRSLFEVSDLEP